MNAARSYAQQAWSGYGQGTWNRTLSFLSSDGLIPQLVLTIIIVLAINLLITTVESIVEGIRKYNQLSATLLPYTYVNKGTAGKQTVTQFVADNAFPNMYPSENEVNGLEFSYSFYLYIDEDNFKTGNHFKNIFYKGSESGPWPVMGPGVFLNGEENAIRIYMNTVDDIKTNYVEVPNIPVQKWFHMVITQKGQNMDVYINGNIAVRKQFSTVPRINFGNLYVFSDKGVPATSKTGVTAGFGVSTDQGAAMNGMISRVKYYSYALSFNQIDALYRDGPSKKIVSKSYDQTPPYFHDSWWVTRYNAGNSHYGV